MPKPKPDQVIRHEIVFGRSERELIEGALVAYQVNKIATPAVALISDISAMTLIFSAIAGYLGWEFIISPGIDTADALYSEFINQYQANKEATIEATEDVAVGVAGAAVGAIPGIGPGGRLGIQYLLELLFARNDPSMPGTTSPQPPAASGGGGGGNF
jgi:hypothetical protein